MDTNLIDADEHKFITNPIKAEETTGEGLKSLSLDIPDDDLIKIVDEWIESDKKFYEDKYNLDERRKKNKKYLFGRQIEEAEEQKKLKKYEARFGDNVLYEIESSIKPLAMARLPDMIVLPGSEDKEKSKTARDLSVAINDTNKKRSQRYTLSLGFKHLPTYFTGVIKARWDPEKGNDGDFRFDIVHPNLVIADHTSKSNNSDDMKVVTQYLPITVQELFMRFPKRKGKLTEALKANGVNISDDPTWAELATEVQVAEVWFDWYKKKGSNEALTKEAVNSTEVSDWEKVTAVLWKYEKVLLDKRLDPNFDHEGEGVLFVDSENEPNGKHQLSEEEIMSVMMSGQFDSVQQEKIFHNYFQKPRKPYFFFGYDQWGEIPYDETSRIEQNIRNQENLDEQGKRIIDKLKQRVKHIWSRESGLTAADVQKMDMENPNLDGLVQGNVDQVHKAISPERPDAAEFKSLQDSRDRMYAVAGANAIRGNLQSDVATSNQIAREADFTRADDLVEDTINAAAEWMADWQMQFIKLRYTEDHMRQIVGAKGAVTFLKLRRDMVQDGMEVTIKASSTDKLKAQRNAVQMAQLKLVDPLTFYEDMDMSDPKGRVEKLLLFNTDPAGYFAKFVMDLQDSQEMAGALQQQPLPPPTPALTPPTANPTPVDTSQVATEPPVGVQASPSMI